MKKLTIFMSTLLGACLIMLPVQSFTAGSPDLVGSIASTNTGMVNGSGTGRVLMTFEHQEKAGSTTTAVEFYHAGKDHYFNTANTGDIAYLEAHPESGWFKTGYTFKVYPLDSAPSGTVAVARYYGALQRNGGYKPDSHFYTGLVNERQLLDDSYWKACPQGQGSCTGEAWYYEKDEYRVYLPSGLSCPSGTRPVYRFYNNGYPTKDSNHRYATDTGVVSDMQAKGWKNEGVKMCAPNDGNNTYTLAVGKEGFGTVTGGGNYSAGDTVRLGAYPDSGYRFYAWNPPPCASSFTMPAYSFTCIATFVTDSIRSPRFNLYSPSSGIAGGQIDISLTAENTSGQSMVFTVGLFLSNDPSTVSSDERIASCNFSLAPGQSDTCAGPIPIPSATLPGSYYLIAYARDDWNAAVNPITINSGGIDL